MSNRANDGKEIQQDSKNKTALTRKHERVAQPKAWTWHDTSHEFPFRMKNTSLSSFFANPVMVCTA